MSGKMSVWQHRILQPALTSLSVGRMGHALLLAGPAQIGKRAVADALIQRLLCTGAEGAAMACGRCRGCGFVGAGSHPDFLNIGLEVNQKTGKLRQEVVVEQIRRLSEWFSLTPQLGGCQVAIIDPADALNASAANALLKTLEEPLPGRYLLLISAAPSRLSATIRSRCQRLQFRLPERAEALAWLGEQGFDPDSSERALVAAGGHPGLAAGWLAGDGLALRTAVAHDMQRLAEGRAGAAAIADAWLSDDNIELRLRFAGEFALHTARRSLTSERVMNKLWQWFVEANRLRGLLATPIRADLALAGLLHQWRNVGQAEDDPSWSRA